jgi:hypothetical protein
VLPSERRWILAGGWAAAAGLILPAQEALSGEVALLSLPFKLNRHPKVLGESDLSQREQTQEPVVEDLAGVSWCSILWKHLPTSSATMVLRDPNLHRFARAPSENDPPS